MPLTTIPIEKETRDKLREFANKSESWNGLLNRLYENALATQYAQVFFASESFSAKELLEKIEKW